MLNLLGLLLHQLEHLDIMQAEAEVEFIQEQHREHLLVEQVEVEQEVKELVLQEQKE
jgi:hypothetical protein